MVMVGDPCVAVEQPLMGPSHERSTVVVHLKSGATVRADRLLVATGRRPRVRGLGLETVGVEADARGVPVDAHLRAAEHLWAIGDVNGLWPLTHVGKYQGDVVAANILGVPRKANYEAVPRVVYTDPQAAAVGAPAGRFSATVPMSQVAKTATLKGESSSALTARELEVLQLIVDGQSNKEIAAKLGLSANTVAVHRANIMDALGIHKTAELVVYAIRNGLVNVP
jgi:pyruvate/2-oxoglutarate dehydrogenase complex dihydrolipoamide dehydrogenase (E3) component